MIISYQRIAYNHPNLRPAVALVVQTPARVATSHFSPVIPKELPQLKPRGPSYTSFEAPKLSCHQVSYATSYATSIP